MAATVSPRKFRLNDVPEPMIKLSLDWIRGGIPTCEAQRLCGNKSVNTTIYRMAVALREAHRQGRLQIVAAP
jgi:hypothetical protein